MILSIILEMKLRLDMGR
jgi:hypothetical protein